MDSGASVDLALGFFLNERMEGEFLWSRQNSRLEADGPAGQLRLSELALYNYMFNLVYNWGMSDARVRPYAFGGVGATNYSFGDLLLPTPLRSTASGIEGETRFSTNWGAGVKFCFAPSVGAKIGLRWTPRVHQERSRRGVVRSVLRLLAAGRRRLLEPVRDFLRHHHPVLAVDGLPCFVQAERRPNRRPALGSHPRQEQGFRAGPGSIARSRDGRRALRLPQGQLPVGNLRAHHNAGRRVQHNRDIPAETDSAHEAIAVTARGE